MNCLLCYLKVHLSPDDHILREYDDHGNNSKQINAMAWLNDKLNQAWYNEWSDMTHSEWAPLCEHPNDFSEVWVPKLQYCINYIFPKKCIWFNSVFFIVFILSDLVIYIPLSFRVASLTLGKLADNKPIQSTNTRTLCPLPMLYCISSTLQ